MEINNSDLLQGYPPGAVTLGASSGIIANAVAAASFPATANRTNYISSAHITGLGATLGGSSTVSITGLVGGTRIFALQVPAGLLASTQPLLLNFNPALKASGPNIAIAVSATAFGLGNTFACVNVAGYQL